MATCTVSGTLTDCTSTPLVGMVVQFTTQSPGFSVEPVAGVTTSSSSGAWSLSILQGTSGQFTIYVPNGSTGNLVPYKFNAVIPSATSANFSTIVEDA
jgi:hypothetical protein